MQVLLKLANSESQDAKSPFSTATYSPHTACCQVRQECCCTGRRADAVLTGDELGLELVRGLYAVIGGA